MPDLFYCPNLSASPVTLDGSEAHHAIHVLRLKPEAAIDLFDGQGRSVSGTVAAVNRRDVVVEFSQAVQHSERPHGLRVAAAIPKGDRLKWMVEKLAEMGVCEYIPLLTERGVVKPGDNKLEKLTATVVAACKQSRNSWLMSIARPIPLTELLADIPGPLVIAHPPALMDAGLASDRTVTRQEGVPATSDDLQTLLVGPEGGFTTAEVETAIQSGARPIGWPDSILRIETAAVVFAAQLMQEARP